MNAGISLYTSLGRTAKKHMRISYAISDDDPVGRMVSWQFSISNMLFSSLKSWQA